MTDAVASFAWRMSGSSSSRPWRTRTKQRVPTLPTPTTFEREIDEPVSLEERSAVLRQRRSIVAEDVVERAVAAFGHDVGQDGRVVDDDAAAIHDGRQRPEGARPVLPTRTS